MGLSVRDRLGLAVGLAVGRIIYGMLTIVSSLHSPANCRQIESGALFFSWAGTWEEMRESSSHSRQLYVCRICTRIFDIKIWPGNTLLTLDFIIWPLPQE